jgi:hypothetical protein
MCGGPSQRRLVPPSASQRGNAEHMPRAVIPGMDPGALVSSTPPRRSRGRVRRRAQEPPR